MTVQQQVANRIINMSDEGAMFINQVINNMNPVFFNVNTSGSAQGKMGEDMPKRFGIAKGYMDECKNFDKWNNEIADLFEGNRI